MYVLLAGIVKNAPLYVMTLEVAGVLVDTKKCDTEC